MTTTKPTMALAELTETGADTDFCQKITHVVEPLTSADVENLTTGRVRAYPVRGGRPIKGEGRLLATFPAARDAEVDGRAVDDACHLLVA